VGEHAVLGTLESKAKQRRVTEGFSTGKSVSYLGDLQNFSVLYDYVGVEF
jgi:hypothetical protein